jgi:hypothetical protein
MKLKEGVRLTDLAPQMVLCALVVEEVFAEFGIPCVVTSANDSKHGASSWHYRGRALDFRTKYEAVNGREQILRDETKKALGQDFDVVIEAVGTDNEHLHVEWDPK